MTSPPSDQQPEPPRMPGWVKWPAIVLGILIVVFVVLRLLGVQHGPGMHSPGGSMPSGGTHAPAGGHR